MNQSIVKNENLHGQRVMSLVQASNIYQETHTHTHKHTHTHRSRASREGIFHVKRGCGYLSLNINSKQTNLPKYIIIYNIILHDFQLYNLVNDVFAYKFTLFI